MFLFHSLLVVFLPRMIPPGPYILVLEILKIAACPRVEALGVFFFFFILVLVCLSWELALESDFGCFPLMGDTFF